MIGRTLLIVLLVGSILVMIVASASAHVSRGPNWYFHKGTKKAVNDAKDIDPLVLLYRSGVEGSNTADEDTIVSMLQTDWSQSNPTFPMKRQGCLQRTTFADNVGEEFGFSDGPQGVVFRDLEDQRRDFDKPADFETGTNPKCRNQWHMRWWEDRYPHTETDHGPTGQWAIAAIHREKYVGFSNGGHALVKVGGRYWDSYRQVAVNRHKNRCRLSRWRMYPGGNRPFQNKDHDGYFALVEMRRSSVGDGDPERCFPDR